MGSQRQSTATRASAAKRVVVVGAGIGGLACAADLARSGAEVVVVERAASIGGKLREVAIGPRRLDAGPTVFTMRWVFDELFADAGTTLADHLDLQPVTTLARHAWPGGERLDLFTDIDRSAEAIAAFADADEARRFRAFCSRASATYRTLEKPFLRSARPTPWSLTARLGWRGLPDLVRTAPFSTLWNRLGDHFRDPRLRQLFGRYATYCGSSPFQAPATLMLVADVERQGVWLVGGGMRRVVLALGGLAERHGATLLCGRDVREITVRNGRATGVAVDGPGGSEFIPADSVVFNGDVAALGAGLLGIDAMSASRRVAVENRSLSALTWNVVGEASGFPLLHHNVFFGSDGRDEFDSIFSRAEMPRQPTVYVCAQDRGADGERVGVGPERLLCLVNAPARGDWMPWPDAEIARCHQRMTDTLAHSGLKIEASPEQVVVTTPGDFERLYPASGGSLYGRSSHGWAASFIRPGARSRIENLYLAGGTVHPGPGVPMAALSGRLAATSLLQDQLRARGSIARFPIPATSGGTSTP